MAQLSDEAVAALAKMIDEEGRKWVEQYVAGRQAALTKKGAVVTGELINSLQYAITQTLQQGVQTTIEIAFDEHGRYIDMKRLNVPSGGTDYISNIAAWIVRKNLYQKYLSKYLISRKLKKAPPSALNNMAWAVAISRKSRTYRRKTWYAKSSSGAVTDLYNRVAANLPDIVMDQLKKQFPQNK